MCLCLNVFAVSVFECVCRVDVCLLCLSVFAVLPKESIADCQRRDYYVALFLL